MPNWRLILSASVLAFALLAPSLAHPDASTPQNLLAAWLTALDQQDFTAYSACIHPLASGESEYASTDAMVFWTGEINDLEQEGFSGQFDLVTVTVGDDRFPTGSVKAFPIVNGQPISEFLLLFQDGASWKILRLFS